MPFEFDIFFKRDMRILGYTDATINTSLVPYDSDMQKELRSPTMCALATHMLISLEGGQISQSIFDNEYYDWALDKLGIGDTEEARNATMRYIRYTQSLEGEYAPEM